MHDLKKFSSFFDKNRYAHIKDLKTSINCYDENIDSFQDYWNRLHLDYNFKDYTHRKRRILRYHYTPKTGKLEINYNSEYLAPVVYDNIPYQKGKNKLTYAEEGFIQHPITKKIISSDLDFLSPYLEKKAHYDINIHLFRVQSESPKPSPTTSGIHQDGMDFIAMHFIHAKHTVPVVSNLYNDSTSESLVFSNPMDSFLETLIVDDKKMYHSASDVAQKTPGTKAYRDILLVSLQKHNEAQ